MIKNKNAFTLLELVIVLIILFIILGIAIPEYIEIEKDSTALQCGNIIKTIERAKEAFRKDYPGQQITDTNYFINNYLGGQAPADPWGVGFSNEFNVNVITTHPYNGNTNYEPTGNCSMSNGYNDSYQQQ